LEHPALTANFRKYTDFTPLAVDFCGRIIPGETEKTFDLAAQYQVQSELGIIGSCGTLSAGFRLIDAVQAAGKLPIERNADGWIISGVKFGSPSGAAMILAPNGKFTEKLLRHAEKCRREDYGIGRVSVPEMLTMAYALEKAVCGMDENFKKVSAINEFIRREVAGLGIFPTLPETVKTSPYILNLLLPEQESAVVVRALSEKGVFVASGSACSAESNRPSAALTALGMPAVKAYRALRLSFGADNSQEDAEIFISELKTMLKNY
jgi:cysteine desulfurase